MKQSCAVRTSTSSYVSIVVAVFCWVFLPMFQDAVNEHRKGRTSSALRGGSSDVPLNNRRPIIESHLGNYLDTDEEDSAGYQRDDWLEDFIKARHVGLPDGSRDELSPLLNRRSTLEVCN
jgi:hypothetical protein